MEQSRPQSTAPLEEYGEQYFESYNYADRGLGRFSMYWFARRYYAGLVKRYAPTKQTGRLLEIGSGLGHLLTLLNEDFDCYGIDIAYYAAKQTYTNAPDATALVASADQLAVFGDQSFDVIVALHLVEHLEEPQTALGHMHRMLSRDGLLLYATPNPIYKMRRYREQPDAIAKDPTHINVHPPDVWHEWTEAADFRVLKHFGDGLWDVPYLPLLPKTVQFGIFGLPSLFQVLTVSSVIPLSMGVNQIAIARKV